MTSPTQFRTVALRDGSAKEVRRGDLIAAAKTIPEDPDADYPAHVDGRVVSALRLVAMGAGVQETQLRLSQVLSLIDEMDFQPIDMQARREVPETTLEAGEALSGVVEPDITPALASQLQRFTNQWVAIQRGRLLGTGQSLGDLLASLSGREATVLFIPTRSEHRESVGE